MKFKPLYFVIVIVALLASACGQSSTPTPAPPTAAPTLTLAPTSVPPTPTPTPTKTPLKPADIAWERISTSNRIVFGTSVDYKPFEYFDNRGQIIGFDPGVARELGARLGLRVEFKDIPFEHLWIALNTGQIDAAIAAISVTPERLAQFDFTNVYFTGQDAILARQGSGIRQIASIVQLSPYRIGVQRNTLYDKWVQDTLVKPGLISEKNLLQYEKSEHAIRDLKENRTDVVLMDATPAKEFLLSGGLELIGQGLNVQLFAIALPKGSDTLKSKLNEGLTKLQNEGTLARLAKDYLQTDVTKVTPIPTPTMYVVPTMPPVECYDGMDLVADVTIPDGTLLQPGEDFDKVWRFRNTGTCTWNNGYKIVFVQGDIMEGAWQPVKAIVRPGETYDMVIDQRAPRFAGFYQGQWQMINAKNIPFGTRVWVRINVPGAPPTAVPTLPPTPVPPTPVPPTRVPPTPVQPTLAPPIPVQPTLAPAPVQPKIDTFKADSDSVKLGGLITLKWSFQTNAVVKARLSRKDPDGTVVQLFGGQDVTTPGSYEDMAMKAGPVVYTLLVSTEFGGTIVETITVNVK
jgi:ABC-type amino acid transport substrate-binding protein